MFDLRTIFAKKDEMTFVCTTNELFGVALSNKKLTYNTLKKLLRSVVILSYITYRRNMCVNGCSISPQTSFIRVVTGDISILNQNNKIWRSMSISCEFFIVRRNTFGKCINSQLCSKKHLQNLKSQPLTVNRMKSEFFLCTYFWY